MEIIRGYWRPISAILIIFAMTLAATAIDRQSSATDFDPDYPIGTPPILGGTGYVTETSTGWHNAQDWGKYNTDYSGYHPGEDWNYGTGTADVGKPVYTIAAGTVIDIRDALFNDRSGYGSGIAIEHTLPSGEKIYSVYEHIDIISGLGIGDPVWQGDRIGSIADTSKLPPHLHFEIRTKQVDTEDWYPNDNGYGYYASEEKLRADGFTVDPSDFIDSHRSVVESVDAGTASQVTLTLYVHDGSAAGPIIPDATVTGQDASGNSFMQATNNEGYVTISGKPGTWSFSASAEGHVTETWRQDITEYCTKHASLQEEQSAESWIQKGSDFYNQTEYDEALQAYQKAIDLDANSAIAWDGKGDALELLGMYDEALEAHEKATELDPNSANAWDGKGSDLWMLNRYDEALQAYQKATELDPNSANIWNNKGTVFYDQGKYEEAIKCYDEAIMFKPEVGLYWYNEGNALKALGKYNEAESAYSKAKELGFVSSGDKSVVDIPLAR